MGGGSRRSRQKKSPRTFARGRKKLSDKKKKTAAEGGAPAEPVDFVPRLLRSGGKKKGRLIASLRGGVLTENIKCVLSQKRPSGDGPFQVNLFGNRETRML